MPLKPAHVATHDDVVRVAELPSTTASTAGSPRIEEVARLAGVSPITVSRALRQPDKLSAATRLKVLEAVERTGYESNPHARALRSGRSTLVAAFVSNIMSQQFGLAVQGLARELEPQGYELMIGQTSYSYAKEIAMVRSLRSLRPAAVMFTGVIELEENRRALRELGIPVVETWAFPRDPIDMLVGFSNVDAGVMAARHLLGKSYRRLAFIGRSGGRGALRLKGFRDEAARLGTALTQVVTVPEVQSISDGRAALAKLFSVCDSVDAVFCANDLLATGAVIEARSRGIAVPEQVAILGFGDNDTAGQISPGLTTITMDAFELGRRAGQMLKARLGGIEPTEPIQNVPLELLIRSST
ncbi:MAG TPA: LacI family DNA-binding transcriptional regulator [Bosea sp. (in: a-proteobacteria)]